METESKRAVIIGGGVIGLACGYYLARDGKRVTVIERSKVGQGASHGNCGLICPSHCLPLAEPGAIRTALASVFQPNSAFRIKPRIDSRLWSWLIQFARHCNHRDMLAGGRAIHLLLQSSMKLYRELIAQERLDCEWENRGLLYVYGSKRNWDDYARISELMNRSFGVSAKRLKREQVLGLEPALNEQAAGGWYFEDDAHLRPDKLIAALRNCLRAYGAEIRENCEFLGFTQQDQVVTAVQTNDGLFPADLVVVATGAITRQLEERIGCRVPIEPGKGYSITMPRPSICPKIPLIFPEYHVAVTPMQSAYRLGSIIEFSGFDATIPPRRIELLTNAARKFLREPICEPVSETWCGWRPMTPDSLPVIDRFPRYRNAWLAAGHNMLGVSMATGTGKLVSELIDGRIPHLDVRPFSLVR